MTTLADHYAVTQDPALYVTEVEDPGFKVNLAVNNEARVLIFINKPFRKRMSWLEFDLNHNRLDFVMNNGDVRNFGIAVEPELVKYMKNSHQVMMILVNEENGEPEEGRYYPLIIHRT